MKKIIIIALFLTSGLSAFAGNKDRSGQAGASELLINPWARSSGLSNINQARVTGFESMRLNIAGLAFTKKLELGFARSIYMAGSGLGVSAFGMGINLGEDKGVLGVDLMSVNFGDIQITTTDLPDGGTGTYKPQFISLGVSYAKSFSNAIHGGVTVRGITERIADVGATGVALDAGIQYVSGKDDNIHFGISLKNVGTPMRFSGDGLSYRSDVSDKGYQLTVNNRAEKFELPTVLAIGGAYDFYFDDNEVHSNRLTAFANFTSNSFTKDQIGLGLEYALREMFMLRVGYNYEPQITSSENRTNVFTGLSGGVSFDVPLKKDGPKICIDYSYRTTNPFNGTHTLGLKLNL